MAGESKNLLTRTLAGAAHEQMQLYVVYNGNDYRILLSTLLSLVTKAKLGLGNVDNTADADKPISNLTQQALDLKADKDNSVSKEEWNWLMQQLNGYVSIIQLSQIINDLNHAINTKATPAEVQGLINTALSPITQAISSINEQLSNLNTADQGFVTQANLTNALNAVNQTIDDLNAAFTSYMQSNDARVLSLEERVAVLESNMIVLGPHYW